MVKKIFYFFFSLAFVSVLTAQTDYQIAAIAFYNFENLHDTVDDPIKNDAEFLPGGIKNYTGDVYRDKLSKLADVVSQLGVDHTPDGPAIIGLAEIENVNVLRDFVKQPKIASRNYTPILVEGPDRRGVDVGMLYNPKYFTPIKVKSLFVPLIRENGDTSFTRDILWVKGVLLNEVVHIFVNHWPSRRGGEEATNHLRKKAASVCRGVIDSLLEVNPDTKILVMGDLNDDPVNESVQKILNARKDATKLEDGQLFNPFAMYYQNGIGSLAWNNAWNLFDQIILSQGWLNREQSGFFYNQAEVFNRPFLTQKTGNFKGYPFRSYIGDEYTGGYSDHFPVLVYLVKKISN